MIRFAKHPNDDYELMLGVIGTGIFWQGHRRDLRIYHGIDEEVEAITKITDSLCDLYPPLKFDYGRTRLEIVVALASIGKE